MKEIINAIKHLANSMVTNTVTFNTSDDILKLSQALDILPDIDYGSEAQVDELIHQNKVLREEVDRLKDRIKVQQPSTSTSFINATPKEPSVAIKNALEKAKAIDSNKKSFPTTFDPVEPPREIKQESKRSYTKWTKQEEQVIKYVMLPDTAKSRQTLSYVAGKFPERTLSSVKSKLRKMNIDVNKGKLYRGDKYES